MTAAPPLRPPVALHALVITHTPLHLRRCLRAVSEQTLAPASITVSCDGDTEELRAVIRDAAADLHKACCAPFQAVVRAHTGASRSAQVRNNGVRTLLGSPNPPAAADLLVMLDGDIVLEASAFDLYTRLAEQQNADVLIGYRVDLSPEQTQLAADRFVHPSSEQLLALLQRDRRYRRQRLLRRIRLGKPHKPKLLSANFAVRFGALLAVNGFDEQYVGYGQEDDDLGRRLFRSGARDAVAVRDVLALHLHHPTRAPGAWHDSPNAARFRAGWAEIRRGRTRCMHGIEDPAQQPEVRVLTFAE